MRGNIWLRRSITALLLLVVFALTCAALAYRTLWNRYDSALQQLEPRSERLEGIVNAGAEIETLLGSASSTVTPWVHPAGESAQNDVQQQLRQMIVASGSTLVSSQVALEPEGEGKLARIRLTATINGDWAKLLGFMESLQRHRPPFWVRTVNITREGVGSGSGPQMARITLQLEAPLARQGGKP